MDAKTTGGESDEGQAMCHDRLVAEMPHVYAFCRSLCRDEHAAWDATQEAVARAWEHRGRYDTLSRLRPWVLKIARNVCIDMRRRSARLPSTWAEPPEVGDPAQPCPVDRLILDENREAVRRAIARLPMGQREVLVLRYQQQLAGREIAALLGLRLEAVRVRLFRAKQALREELMPMREISS